MLIQSFKHTRSWLYYCAGKYMDHTHKILQAHNSIHNTEIIIMTKSTTDKHCLVRKCTCINATHAIILAICMLVSVQYIVGRNHKYYTVYATHIMTLYNYYQSNFLVHICILDMCKINRQHALVCTMGKVSLKL